MADLAQKLPLDQMQNKWASQLNPLLKNPLNNASVLNGIVLTTGANVINHKLGAPLQGWFVVGINAAITLFDTQATNQTPQLTLNLTASGPATINLAVF